MSNKSNDYNDAMHPHLGHDHRQKQSNSPNADTLDSSKRDRWELLNAYLDSEVTPKEKRMVERWLQEDQKMQCLYARLLQLRCHIQSAPVPPTNTSVEEVVQGVCRRIDRQRLRRNIMLGGVAIAALVGALVSGNVNLKQLPAQFIQQDDLPELGPDGLVLPLNESLVPTLENVNDSSSHVDVPLGAIISTVDESPFETPNDSSN
ncbi:MAG: Fis family transcriptional regulator [Cyanobacteria bacterium P01_E01_bin.6]